VNVFVIDDDPSVRKALQRLFRSAGMIVETFASAEEFLEAGLAPPDCLVLDVRLAGISGLQLQQRLTANEQDIPIVFISAHDDEVARERALQAGAEGFLLKPFEDHVLLSTLAQAVARRDAHATLNHPSRDAANQRTAAPDRLNLNPGDTPWPP
jgi:FixJ family two-component response regulator